jgi:hypothetical protein
MAKTPVNNNLSIISVPLQGVGRNLSRCGPDHAMQLRQLVVGGLQQARPAGSVRNPR